MPPRLKEPSERSFAETQDDRLELASFLSLRRQFKRYLEGGVERWELSSSIQIHCKVYNKEYIEVAAML